jgi:hypothetical protein
VPWVQGILNKEGIGKTFLDGSAAESANGGGCRDKIRIMTLRVLVLTFLAGRVIAQDCASSAVGFRVMHIESRVVAVWYPTASRPSVYSYSPSFSGVVAVNAPASMTCD